MPIACFSAAMAFSEYNERESFLAAPCLSRVKLP
jgi:hypothetical protein